MVSETTAVKPPAELIRLSTVILLNADALASLTNNSSEPETISPEVIDVCPVINEFSVVPVNSTVPLAFGKLIVLSAVGSMTPNVVSLSSSVVPSKMKDAADNVDVTVNSATDI